MAEGLCHFELNTGARIPSVGLGSYGLSEEDIVAAVKIGYRHIDCAALYGNEKEVGCALKRLFAEGVVKREDLFITSKLWGSDHLPDDVPVSFEITLHDLQLDYVDLYLIHWPVSFKKGTKSDAYCPDNLTIPDIPSTWRAMEALYESRKARAIGVSNFSTKKLSDLLAIARVPPAVNQVELHPAWQQPKLHQFCQSHGVHLTGYSPLGSPFWGPEERNVLDRPVVKTTAERLGKTPAQVVLRWGLQAGHSVIPKSKTESRLKENLDLFHWSIPQDMFLQFSEIKQERFATGAFYVHEAYGTYRSLDDLWDGEI